MKYLLILLVLGFAESVTAAEFTYRGHSYIWFHHPGGWDGIVHNPDCKCNKK